MRNSHAVSSVEKRIIHHDTKPTPVNSTNNKELIEKGVKLLN